MSTPSPRCPSRVLAATLLALATACGDEPTAAAGARPAAAAPSELARWSDPRSWPGGAVPTAGASVTVPAGATFLLDVSPPPLGTLSVEGTLVFADRDLALTATAIRVRGTLRVGTETRPFTRRATITLTGAEGGDSTPGLTSKALAVLEGGTLDLHGAPRVGWTRLAATAPAGAAQLQLEREVDWAAGDRIVLAPTDFEPAQYDEAVVKEVAGRTVTLEQPLRYRHWGELQTVAGRTLDERAEVGLLSRNVVFRGDEACAASGYCAHVIAFQGGTMRIEGVELHLVGQKFKVARYPIHWHVAQDVGGQYARGNSIWRTFNRCVTVHGSHAAVVEGNVCHDHLGHGYFLEDGVEARNVIAGNLGVYGRTPSPTERLLPSDSRPATFWITNPDNTVRGNVAAGSTGWGFWYALPLHPTGMSTTDAVWPRTTPLREFSGNVAHSNRTGALNVDEGPRPDGTTETTSYAPRANPAATSAAVVADFHGLVAWKHRGRAVWLRTRAARLSDALLADNGIGATFASSDTYLEDALLVGESANNATAFPTGFPVRGYEFYDGTVGARRTTFVNYVASARGPASAFGFNRTNAFPLSTLNFAEDARFENANRAWLLAPQADKDGDKAAVFLDRDGSVTGTAGRYVVADVPFLVGAGCERRAEWNAHVCAGGYGRLAISSGATGEHLAPATVTRDDGVALQLAGSGNQLTALSLSVPLDRRYVVAPPAAVTRPRVALTGVPAGAGVRLSIPFAGAAATVWRDYATSDRLSAATSLAELDASAGEKFHLAGGVLHLKLVVKAGRDYAAVHADQR
jgi:cell migration-inducing and hyaluronan-binding protein